jgi:hypothetical protein
LLPALRKATKEGKDCERTDVILHMCQQLNDVTPDVDHVGLESCEDVHKAGFERSELVRKAMRGFGGRFEGMLLG